MSDIFLGVDTSAYTTSVACVDEKGIVSDRRTVLSVGFGERGLRQSDALFMHVKNLPPLMGEALEGVDRCAIRAVGVSARPRQNAESYMPVFLAGRVAASGAASALGVPLYEFAHQQGHLRAALLDNEELIGKGFIGMHISGGTTEIFSVGPELSIDLLGGTGDLHAGQLVDRLGVKMGLGFPAGREFEALADAADAAAEYKLPSSVRGMDCSFSGVLTAAERMYEGGADSAGLALAVYEAMARTFIKQLDAAREATGATTALIAGGVASSPRLRRLMLGLCEKKRLGIMLRFGRNALSSDNAVGTALLARNAWAKGGA